MRTITSRGFSAESCSQPRFHFSSAPGRKFSTTIWQVFASRRTISWPSGLRRLQVTDFLLRDCTCHQSEVPLRILRHLRSGSPSPGGSILITSAPKSARVLPQNGPAIRLPSSITRTPVRGPAIGRLCRDDAESREMKRAPPSLLTVAFACASFAAAAVEQAPVAPGEEKVTLMLGAFLPSLSTRARVDAELGSGDRVDLARDLGL